MYDPGFILERLRLGEDTVTEFKSVVHLDFREDRERVGKLLHDIACTISAFANTRGGLILLGVEDDATLTGVGDRQRCDDLMKRLADVCHTVIDPPISCPIEKMEVEDTPVMAVEVPAYAPGRPYRAGRVYYIRDGSRDRVARTDELKRILQSTDTHYDEQPVHGATRSDLDGEAIAHFLQSAYRAAASGPLDAATVDRYLSALKCVDAEGKPTVAGVLFFASAPSRWMPDARISAVRFRGTAMSSEFEARKEIGGALPSQLAAARAFLDDYLRSPSRLEGWERAEEGVPPDGLIPGQVLREAVRNALMHRDYRAASQTRLFVFDDRVEIVNPGTLLNQLTLDSIRLGGMTQRRNPTVADLVNRLQGRETIGMGVPEMIRAMRECGLPEPELDVSGGHFRVVLWARPKGAE